MRTQRLSFGDLHLSPCSCSLFFSLCDSSEQRWHDSVYWARLMDPASADAVLLGAVEWSSPAALRVCAPDSRRPSSVSLRAQTAFRAGIALEGAECSVSDLAVEIAQLHVSCLSQLDVRCAASVLLRNGPNSSTRVGSMTLTSNLELDHGAPLRIGARDVSLRGDIIVGNGSVEACGILSSTPGSVSVTGSLHACSNWSVQGALDVDGALRVVADESGATPNLSAQPGSVRIDVQRAMQVEGKLRAGLSRRVGESTSPEFRVEVGDAVLRACLSDGVTLEHAPMLVDGDFVTHDAPATVSALRLPMLDIGTSAFGAAALRASAPVECGSGLSVDGEIRLQGPTYVFGRANSAYAPLWSVQPHLVRAEAATIKVVGGQDITVNGGARFLVDSDFVVGTRNLAVSQQLGVAFGDNHVCVRDGRATRVTSNGHLEVASASGSNAPLFLASNGEVVVGASLSVRGAPSVRAAGDVSLGGGAVTLGASNGELRVRGGLSTQGDVQVGGRFSTKSLRATRDVRCGAVRAGILSVPGARCNIVVKAEARLNSGLHVAGSSGLDVLGRLGVVDSKTGQLLLDISTSSLQAAVPVSSLRGDVSVDGALSVGAALRLSGIGDVVVDGELRAAQGALVVTASDGLTLGNGIQILNASTVALPAETTLARGTVTIDAAPGVPVRIDRNLHVAGALTADAAVSQVEVLSDCSFGGEVRVGPAGVQCGTVSFDASTEIGCDGLSVVAGDLRVSRTSNDATSPLLRVDVVKDGTGLLVTSAGETTMSRLRLSGDIAVHGDTYVKNHEILVQGTASNAISVQVSDAFSAGGLSWSSAAANNNNNSSNAIDDIKLAGALRVEDQIEVARDLCTKGTLRAAGDVRVGSTLAVEGVLLANSSRVALQRDAEFAGGVSIESGDCAVGGELWVSRNLTVRDGALRAGGAPSNAFDVGTGSDLTFHVPVAFDRRCEVHGDVTVDGAVNVVSGGDGGMDVDGDLVVSGGALRVHVDPGSKYAMEASVPVDVRGDLLSQHDVAIGADLEVGGSVEAHGSTHVLGDVSVAQAAVLGAPVSCVGDVSIAYGRLAVWPEFWDGPSSVKSAPSAPAYQIDDLYAHLHRDVYLSSGIQVGSNLEVGNDVSCDGLSCRGGLNVFRDALLRSDLTVVGRASIGDLQVGALDVGGANGDLLGPLSVRGTDAAPWLEVDAVGVSIRSPGASVACNLSLSGDLSLARPKSAAAAAAAAGAAAILDVGGQLSCASFLSSGTLKSADATQVHGDVSASAARLDGPLAIVSSNGATRVAIQDGAAVAFGDVFLEAAQRVEVGSNVSLASGSISLSAHGALVASSLTVRGGVLNISEGLAASSGQVGGSLRCTSNVSDLQVAGSARIDGALRCPGLHAAPGAPLLLSGDLRALAGATVENAALTVAGDATAGRARFHNALAVRGTARVSTGGAATTVVGDQGLRTSGAVLLRPLPQFSLAGVRGTYQDVFELTNSGGVAALEFGLQVQGVGGLLFRLNTTYDSSPDWRRCAPITADALAAAEVQLEARVSAASVGVRAVRLTTQRANSLVLAPFVRLAHALPSTLFASSKVTVSPKSSSGLLQSLVSLPFPTSTVSQRAGGVGVGVALPRDGRLEVNGTSLASSLLLVGDGTGASPSLAVCDGSGAFHDAATGSLVISAGSTPRINLTSNIVHVVDSNQPVTNSTSNTALAVDGTIRASAPGRIVSGERGVYYVSPASPIASGSRAGLFRADANALALRTGGREKWRIDAGGLWSLGDGSNVAASASNATAASPSLLMYIAGGVNVAGAMHGPGPVVVGGVLTAGASSRVQTLRAAGGGTSVRSVSLAKTGSRFVGRGAGLSNLDANNFSTGVVPIASLPRGDVAGVQGVVRLTDAFGSDRQDVALTSAGVLAARQAFQRTVRSSVIAPPTSATDLPIGSYVMVDKVAASPTGFTLVLNALLNLVLHSATASYVDAALTAAAAGGTRVQGTWSLRGQRSVGGSSYSRALCQRVS